MMSSTPNQIKVYNQQLSESVVCSTQFVNTHATVAMSCNCWSVFGLLDTTYQAICLLYEVQSCVVNNRLYPVSIFKVYPRAITYTSRLPTVHVHPLSLKQCFFLLKVFLISKTISLKRRCMYTSIQIYSGCPKCSLFPITSIRFQKGWSRSDNIAYNTVRGLCIPYSS